MHDLIFFCSILYSTDFLFITGSMAAGYMPLIHEHRNKSPVNAMKKTSLHSEAIARA